MTQVTSRPFFQTPDGKETMLFTLQNQNGMQVCIAQYGAAITSVLVPDRAGNMADVVLAYDTYETSSARTGFLGKTVGRCCNRIKNGKFSLNGKTYQLALNDKGQNHLHGGNSGLDNRVWDASVIAYPSGEALCLQTVMEDGEENYPGRLEVKVVFSLSSDNGLQIDYSASGDADTVCNLTNHAYFNLAGHDSGTILNQQIMIYADYFTQTDAQSIPTGKDLIVEGTPFDFTEFHEIGERIADAHEQLQFGCGYDHNFILRSGDKAMGPCAELYDPASGRHMFCYTDSPCVQFYSANHLDVVGKNNTHYGKHSGLCLETQYAPDSVNHPEWPNPILKQGEQFAYTTIYKFSVK